MKILGMGVPEFLIIAAVIILVFFVFGPKNLPKLGTAFGKAVKNLKEGMNAGKKKVEEKVDEANAASAAKAEEAELVAVIDKPAPGQKPAAGAKAAQAEETAE